MRSYFITVRSHETAKKVDPNAVLIRTLPATTHHLAFCCKPGITTKVSEAFVYRVQVECRRQAEHAVGVIKCRANEPKQYKTFLFSRAC